MKKIFIYYSNTGNGDAVATCLKNKGYEIRKVISKEPLPQNRILSIITGGYKAMIGYKDKLDNFDDNIKEYDEVIIGSPIWNDRLSSPINAVLSKIDLNKKVAKFILYSGSGTAKKARELIYQKYPRANIIDLKEPKKYPEELNKIKC